MGDFCRQTEHAVVGCTGSAGCSGRTSVVPMAVGVIYTGDAETKRQRQGCLWVVGSGDVA